MIEDKPMTVGELIEYLQVYNCDRIVLLQASENMYCSVDAMQIRNSKVKKIDPVNGVIYGKDDDGDIYALILG